MVAFVASHIAQSSVMQGERISCKHCVKTGHEEANYVKQIAYWVGWTSRRSKVEKGKKTMEEAKAILGKVSKIGFRFRRFFPYDRVFGSLCDICHLEPIPVELPNGTVTMATKQKVHSLESENENASCSLCFRFKLYLDFYSTID